MKKSEFHCDYSQDFVSREPESILHFCFGGEISKNCKNEKCKKEKLRAHRNHSIILAFGLIPLNALLTFSIINKNLLFLLIAITVMFIFVYQAGGFGRTGDYIHILIDAYLSDNPKKYLRKEIMKRTVKFVVYSCLSILIIWGIVYIVNCVAYYNNWYDILDIIEEHYFCYR